MPQPDLKRKSKEGEKDNKEGKNRRSNKNGKEKQLRLVEQSCGAITDAGTNNDNTANDASGNVDNDNHIDNNNNKNNSDDETHPSVASGASVNNHNSDGNNNNDNNSDNERLPSDTNVFAKGNTLPVSSISEGHPTNWALYGSPKILRAVDYNVPKQEFDNSVLVLMFLSFNPQMQQKTFNGYTASRTIMSGGTQRRKPLPLTTMTSSIAMFGDMANYPYCCAYINPKKATFQNLWGNKAHALENFRVGDLVVFAGCKHTTDTLGENIVIIKEPQFAVKLKSDWAHWPNLRLNQSSLANDQTFFREQGKRIIVHNVRALTSKDDIPCMNVTCDRQSR